MARASKGQQVKSFKDMIPQPDQSQAPTITKVYFKAEEGHFYIYVPEHIAAVVKTGIEGLRSFSDGTYISSNVMQDVIDSWAEVKGKYERLLRTEGAVKVIRYAVRAQHPRINQYGTHNLSQFKMPMGSSLGRGLVLQLHYEVLYRSGNRLYDGRYDGDSLILHDRGAVPNAGPFDNGERVIDWTEEREAFFKAMHAGMDRLIMQMIEFLGGDIEANIAALASGERTLMLAAPKVND